MHKYISNLLLVTFRVVEQTPSSSENKPKKNKEAINGKGKQKTDSNDGKGPEQDAETPEETASVGPQGTPTTKNSNVNPMTPPNLENRLTTEEPEKGEDEPVSNF